MLFVKFSARCLAWSKLTVIWRLKMACVGKDGFGESPKVLLGAQDGGGGYSESG